MPLVKKNAMKFALATALALGMGGAAAAQNVIVKSSGPSATSYPAGKKLSGAERLSLKAGDSVTILARSGTRVLQGPGTFSLRGRSGVKATSRTRLAKYIKNSSSTKPRAGAVRGAGQAEEPKPTKPEIWYLGLNTSGNFCVLSNNVTLWRPDYTGSSSLDIVSPATGTITKVEWEESKGSVAWPAAAAPVRDGASYRLNASGMGAEKLVTFKMLDAAPLDEVALSEALLSHGCQAQMDELLGLYEEAGSGGAS